MNWLRYAERLLPSLLIAALLLVLCLAAASCRSNAPPAKWIEYQPFGLGPPGYPVSGDVKLIPGRSK